MSLNESVQLEDMELAKFFHDLLLSYMDFTMGIVPESRLKKVTSYIAETMYHFMDFKQLGLMEFNDPVTTLERYCRFLEDNDLAVKVGLKSKEERYGTMWKITISNCLFGNNCRNLRTERFMCPLTLFGGFLVQEACSRRVILDTSTLTLAGCETALSLWDEVLNPQRITLTG